MNETIEEAGNNISDVMKEAGLPDGVLKLIDKIEIKESGELTAIQQAGEKVAQWIVLIISFVMFHRYGVSLSSSYGVSEVITLRIRPILR